MWMQSFRKQLTLPEEAGDDYIYEISVANTEQGHTGGAGTMFYTFGGLAIVAGGGGCAPCFPQVP